VSAASDRPLALLNARIVDPASGLDARGALFVRDGRIEAVVTDGDPGAVGADYETLDAAGALLIPGLVDLRAKTGEPGFETRETLRSASEAAAAGGVTTFVVQPDTDPVIDEASVVDFIRRRARDSSLVNILPAGAATQGCLGERMAEIGLMAEAGCVYVTDADRPIVNSKVMRRVLAYAKGFGMLVAHRPADPWLSEGTAATSGEFAGRMGLPSAPPEAEKIMLERDLALVEMTGARFLADQVTTACALESLERGKRRGLPVFASTSINHLTFNEIDIGDYRTFLKFDPPVRGEDDRQAVIDDVKKNIERVKLQLPPDVRMEGIIDQSLYIKNALSEINVHLVLGSILACLVVLLFMRSWRSTIIAGIAIPASSTIRPSMITV
jgi:dihydroorotase